MPTSLAPPAEQTVTQVPQPTASTFLCLASILRICSSGLGSATIMALSPGIALLVTVRILPRD